MPGPVKARVQASREKTMVLAFFDNKGLVYTNTVPRGQTVNGSYIVKALTQFMRRLRQKRPDLVEGEWFLHWDNAPVHTAAVVQNWLAARGVQVLPHPPYSPDLAPADFFLFPKLKKELAGRRLTAKTFKKEWDGAARTIAPTAYAAAFRKWMDRCNKCIDIGGDYVEKMPK